MKRVRADSRQALPKVNLFASAMLCCYLLWSGDKILSSRGLVTRLLCTGPHPYNARTSNALVDSPTMVQYVMYINMRKTEMFQNFSHPF